MPTTKNLAIIIMTYYVYLFLVTFVFSGVSARAYKGVASVTFFDVGQGDAILIQSALGKKVLIDGGPNFEIDQQIYNLNPFVPCNIEVMVLTHPHADHIVGLNRLLHRCEVGVLLHAPVNYDSRLYEEWDALLAKSVAQRRIKDVVVVTQGDLFHIDSMRLEVIWPSAAFLSYNPRNINNASVVMLLTYNTYSVFLGGDAEIDVQMLFDTKHLGDALSKLTGSSRLYIYKAGHHGADNGTYFPLFMQLQPEVIVVQVGAENKFGHPSQKVLDFFDSMGSKMYRTDLDKHVKLYFL